MVRDRVRIQTFVCEVPSLPSQCYVQIDDSIRFPRTHSRLGRFGVPGLPRGPQGLCAVAQGDSRRRKAETSSAEAQKT